MRPNLPKEGEMEPEPGSLQEKGSKVPLQSLGPGMRAEGTCGCNENKPAHMWTGSLHITGAVALVGRTHMPLSITPHGRETAVSGTKQALSQCWLNKCKMKTEDND